MISETVLKHVVDVHCHPTDAASISPQSMQDLQITICAMSSNALDQSKVANLAQSYPDKVIPAFGYHPWFSASISLINPPESKEKHYRALLQPTPSTESIFTSLLPHLADPTPFSTLITSLRQNLTQFPYAMLGEVGLDRSFRVPFDYWASPRQLTPFTIPLEHQLAVLEAQIDLAIEMERNVSVHSVKSQQATVELMQRLRTKWGDERFDRISVDMHSCGLSPESWKVLEKKHSNVFISLSTVINHKHSQHRSLIAAASPDRLLAESDYNDVTMCTPQTWDIIQIIADVKGWQVEEDWVDEVPNMEQWGVVRRLEANWIRFKNGHHPTNPKKKKKRLDYDSESPDEGEAEN